MISPAITVDTIIYSFGNKRRINTEEKSFSMTDRDLRRAAKAPFEHKKTDYSQTLVKWNKDDANFVEPTRSITIMNPYERLTYLIRSFQLNIIDLEKTMQNDSFFQDHTEDQVNSYDGEVVAAIRTQDIAALRKMLANGRDLQCCNRFGESILHMACRRGFYEVVRFLLQEANVSVKIKDDYGRTPMHDACWGSEANFKIMDLLIEDCPELLLYSDVRGHTPLQYTRREHWGQWISYLNTRGDDICEELSRTKKNYI